MKIYMFPHYVSVTSSRIGSKRLFSFLVSQDIILEGARWEGDLKSLPTTPSIIRASSMMECTWEALGKRCAELGHFCFYDDEVVMADGNRSREYLIDEAKRFLARQVAPR